MLCVAKCEAATKPGKKRTPNGPADPGPHR